MTTSQICPECLDRGCSRCVGLGRWLASCAAWGAIAGVLAAWAWLP